MTKIEGQKDLNYYLNLHWTYKLEWDDEDQIYVVSIAELKGCMSHGKTIEEASYMIKDALKSYISSMLEDNEEIPEPPKPEEYKGRIAYRTTSGRHYRIAKKAVAERKSISKLIDDLIDKGLASS